jgi:integrase
MMKNFYEPSEIFQEGFMFFITARAEKGSDPRILPLSQKAIDMLNNMRSAFHLQRKKIAKKLADARILQIHFHTLRHWKATMEQHKSKDPWHVKTILGHKSIQSTERYIHIEKMLYMNGANDEFTVKVAHTLEEAIKLVEVGYEFHVEMEGLKLFRKRN